MTRRRALIVAAAAAFGLGACSGTPSAVPTNVETSRSAPPRTGEPSATVPAASIPEVWRFSAARVGGGTIEGADLTGEKVAVWLWAPW